MLHQLAPLKGHPDILSLSGFGRPFGLNRDAKGNIYITDMDLHAVFRLSSDLKTIAWLNDVSGWSTPHGVKEGIAQTLSCREPALFNGPHAIEFDDQHHLYVTTYYSPAVLVFNEAGHYLRSIGDQTSQCPLQGPASAFFNRQQELMVAEYALNSIIYYTKAGDWIRRNDVGGLDRPHMMKEGNSGQLYCVDTWNHRIKRMDGQGEDDIIDGFYAPVAISLKANDDFLVTDWGNNRLKAFSNDGKLKYEVNDLGLSKPYDAQYLHEWIVIADSHHGRVLFVPQSYYE